MLSERGVGHCHVLCLAFALVLRVLWERWRELRGYGHGVFCEPLNNSLGGIVDVTGGGRHDDRTLLVVARLAMQGRARRETRNLQSIDGQADVRDEV